ncbi:DUF3040 domain-containing protein [Streptomyces sp. NPDC056056]|uniref:DUF3040 domain-containing protein n=1 Tax=Streptomyces sp. NPDC056056 TaxID=3345698 RepID=UPI0035D84508
MDGPHLSPGERTMLAVIERGLSHDRRLERRMRTMRDGPFRRTRGRLLPMATLVLALVSATLMVLAVTASSAPLIWAFAASWAGTLMCGVCWVRGLCKAVAGSGRR